MKSILFFLIVSSLSFASVPVEKSLSGSEIEFQAEGRMICTVNTGATFSRFNKCRPGNEVMVGIQNFDPLTVLCSNLIINCRSLKTTGASPEN